MLHRLFEEQLPSGDEDDGMWHHRHKDDGGNRLKEQGGESQGQGQRRGQPGGEPSADKQGSHR